MKLGLILYLLWFSLLVSANGQGYLSQLAATADDPIYTTYAASLQRSQYIVDEGYHLRFYQEDQGIDFTTDLAGHLALGFKYNGEFRYHLHQMEQRPVLTVSYSDLVKYYFYPFPGIRVEVFFLVYSSRISLQQIDIINQTGNTATLSIYPFLYYPGDTLSHTNLLQNQDGFSFGHHEPPDGWTTSHGIPHVEKLQDVWMWDTTFTAWGAYHDLGSLTIPTAEEKYLDNYCVEWGLVRHTDGSLCLHTPPQAQQLIFHNASLSEILTEDAPKWGDPDPNIPGNGYQGCELGNFRNPPIAMGDSFEVHFSCLATTESGRGSGIIPPLPAAAGVNTEIQLAQSTAPYPPQNVQVQFSAGNTSAFISWDQIPGLFYLLYRRTASTPGRYDLIADSINATAYLELGLNPDSSYAYVVLARDQSGSLSGHSLEVGNISGVTFFDDVNNAYLSNTISAAGISVIAAQHEIMINPGQSRGLRIVRGVAEADSSQVQLIEECRQLRNISLQPFLVEDEVIYQNIPQINFADPDREMLYWNAFSLIRQCMLPPEGQCSYDYYVFSREPTWGWGHGGQVFHESLTMLAYGFMDPVSAMNSQRVYMERQWPDGYINYRTGPYLNETIPYAGQYTTSAPWYNWENWELFKISQDTAFLQEIYPSGKQFYLYWLNNRDSDLDGLCEWGAHAVLECVRDGQVAIWDQVGWPSNFECLDLNCMLVNEAHSLAEIAEVLGLTAEAQIWRQEATARADSINKYMWDAQTGFYYHVDKIDHDFTFNSTGDLKRQEIIGFLPLWAGIADSQQASQLVQHLTDPNKFWRNYGVPTLSADDPYYNAMGYWNGPVWIQWQYLIFRGLLNYGYADQARNLAFKVMDQVIDQLQENHWFWELYSPDDRRAGWHKAYIWTGLVARMLIDLDSLSTPIRRRENEIPATVELLQNFPNPFNPSTEIKFKIPRSQQVKLTVCDILGRQVKNLLNKTLPAGTYAINWDGTNEFEQIVSSGIYFYRLETEKFTLTRKMILLR